jgi:hypothetical protein
LNDKERRKAHNGVQFNWLMNVNGWVSFNINGWIPFNVNGLIPFNDGRRSATSVGEMFNSFWALLA